jgi:UDP-2-acetamido-2,6-beta-L-arabino-hexul-4-ose reductase
MRVLVTGAEGFLGKNLVVALRRVPGIEVLCFDRNETANDLSCFAAQADVVYHLAGVNRPERVEEFQEDNAGLTEKLVALLSRHGRRVPVVLSSSTQAALENPYGRSKWFVEQMLADCAAAYGQRSVSLRFFNAAGASSSGLIGERHEPETHLIPNVLRACRDGSPQEVSR